MANRIGTKGVDLEDLYSDRFTVPGGNLNKGINRMFHLPNELNISQMYREEEKTNEKRANEGKSNKDYHV